MKLFSRIFDALVSDADVEDLDRRAFCRGMMVTSAGLLAPRPTLFLPMNTPGWTLMDSAGRVTPPMMGYQRDALWTRSITYVSEIDVIVPLRSGPPTLIRKFETP